MATARFGSYAAGLVVALACVLFAATAPGASALSFSGSPVLEYDQPFYIYSPAVGGYCGLVYTARCIQALECSPSFTTPTAAAVITGGSGPIESSTVIMSRLLVNSSGSSTCAAGYATCFVPVSNVIDCDVGIVGRLEFVFSNVVQETDGLLHGGASLVQFSDPYGEQQSNTAGWCTAQNAFSCTGNSPAPWGEFNFVPA